MSTRELAAAYLLEELDDLERARVEDRLRDDDEFRAEVEAMRPIVARLEQLPEDGWPDSGEAAAPPMIDPGAAPSPRQAPRSWRLRPAIAIAALAGALLVGVAAGTLLGDDDGSAGEGPTIALDAFPPASSATAAATLTMSTPEQMQMDVTGVQPSRPGEYYELWLIDGPQRTLPVAAFRVPEGGSTRLAVPLPADPGEYRFFDVSRQRVKRRHGALG